MKKARVRVEARRTGFGRSDVGQLLKIFKRATKKYGIIRMFRQNQFFTRPGDQRRRRKFQRKIQANKPPAPEYNDEWDFYD